MYLKSPRRRREQILSLRFRKKKIIDPEIPEIQENRCVPKIASPEARKTKKASGAVSAMDPRIRDA